MGGAKLIVHNMRCPYCEYEGVGKLLYTGTLKLSDPPMYEHRCDKCGAGYNLPRKYPYTTMEFEEVEQVFDEWGSEIQ